jgi:hypothetical protein
MRNIKNVVPKNILIDFLGYNFFRSRIAVGISKSKKGAIK